MTDYKPMNYPVPVGVHDGRSTITRAGTAAMTDEAIALGLLEPVPVIRNGPNGRYCTTVLLDTEMVKRLTRKRDDFLNPGDTMSLILHDMDDEEVEVRWHLL